MATEFPNPLETFGLDDVAQADAAMDSMLAELQANNTKHSDVVDQIAALTKARASADMDELAPPGSVPNTNVELDVTPTDPLHHPVFDEVRTARRNNADMDFRKQLQDAASTEFLPAKDSDEFVALERGFQNLQKINEEAKKEGKSFFDVWFSDVDKGKMAYANLTQYEMNARAIELALNSKLTQEQIKEQIQGEFAEAIGKLSTDPQYAKLMSMSPDQVAKEFTTGMSAVFRETGRVDFGENLAFRVGKDAAMGRLELAGVMTDIALGFVPFIGTGLGIYMGVTGDDIVVNSFAQEDYKLPGWARGLVMLPVVGPMWRGAKALKAGDGVYNAVKTGLGTDAAIKMITGGPDTAMKYMRELKHSGKWGDMNHLLRSIDNGEIIVSDAERDLVQIIRAVNGEKRAASGLLSRNPDNASPLVMLSRMAIESGDPLARQKINQLILGTMDDTTSLRAQNVIKALGVDSPALQTIAKDTRLVTLGKKGERTSVVSAMNHELTQIKTDIAVKERRLANLEKARQAKAAKVAERKVAADTEARAAEAPDFEDTIGTDATPETAEVGSTIKTPEGGEAKVVEVTEDTVTAVTSEGTILELGKTLKPEAKEFIMNKVKELGSVEKVKIHYGVDGFGNSLEGTTIGKYAVRVAEELFGDAGKVATPMETAAKKIASTVKLKSARKQAAELVERSEAGEDVVGEMETLIERLSIDQVAKPMPQREALIEQLRAVANDIVRTTPSKKPATILRKKGVEDVDDLVPTSQYEEWLVGQDFVSPSVLTKIRQLVDSTGNPLPKTTILPIGTTRVEDGVLLGIEKMMNNMGLDVPILLTHGRAGADELKDAAGVMRGMFLEQSDSGIRNLLNSNTNILHSVRPVEGQIVSFSGLPKYVISIGKNVSQKAFGEIVSHEIGHLLVDQLLLKHATDAQFQDIMDSYIGWVQSQLRELKTPISGEQLLENIGRPSVIQDNLHASLKGIDALAIQERLPHGLKMEEWLADGVTKWASKLNEKPTNPADILLHSLADALKKMYKVIRKQLPDYRESWEDFLDRALSGEIIQQKKVRRPEAKARDARIRSITNKVSDHWERMRETLLDVDPEDGNIIPRLL